MSHGIVKPIDKLFSIESAEWHGLASVVPEITTEIIRPILPPILRGGMSLDLGLPGEFTKEELKKRVSSFLKMENLKPSESASHFAETLVALVKSQVKMPNHQGLVADYRECSPELIECPETSGGLVPLHIPKNSYRPIENREVWEQMQVALQGVGGKVSCVGTLEAGKKFFVSAKLGDGGEFTVNGDKFLANLNFITSHDGTLAMEAYDSTVRIVCMNTLRWSREAAGEVGFKVYHCQGASLAMANLGALVNRILTGRADFRNQMEYLASVSVSLDDARKLVLGYFAEKTESEQLATQAFNAADSILALFRNGAGNKGQTLYDLLNGATEHWTSGDGTGSETSKEEKSYKANFGLAAEHKTAFANLLLAGADNLEAVKAKGEKSIALGKREGAKRGPKAK
jgi:hypothetical protein